MTTATDDVPTSEASADARAAPSAAAGAEVAAPTLGRVVLASSCTIHESAALKAHLLDQLARMVPCELDGSDVEQIDATGVQLLVAFALDCMERNLGFIWKGRSEALERAIELMGVGSLLESPGVSSFHGAG